MCTAISDRGERHLFGRTLDLECSYGETVTLLPRRAPMRFLHREASEEHWAILGMAIRGNGVPLFYDAVNEKGLCIAALNFPHYAQYRTRADRPLALASFELIPWLLGQCETVEQARHALRDACITAESVSSSLPATPLHWLLADRCESLVIEPTEAGLALHENPLGVLSNSPPFAYHLTRLAEFMQLGACEPVNRLCPDRPLVPYARGLGAIGLPGDWSSASRFVRAVFVKQHTAPAAGEAAISRFFHMMGAVAVPDGCMVSEEGRPVRTVYTACMDAAAMRYYYTTYDASAIGCVAPDERALRGERVCSYTVDGRDPQRDACVCHDNVTGIQT